jgi:hypothetical protein
LGARLREGLTGRLQLRDDVLLGELRESWQNGRLDGVAGRVRASPLFVYAGASSFGEGGELVVSNSSLSTWS